MRNPFTSVVKVLPAKVTFQNADTRRAIDGLVTHLPFPFALKQIKLIEFTAKAVKDNLVVGNHRHLKHSGQWEVVLVLGDNKTPLFRFRYKNRKSKKVLERTLSGGDVVLIPPGCTLAFLALAKGARLIEISNQEYDAKNYVKEVLFS